MIYFNKLKRLMWRLYYRFYKKKSTIHINGNDEYYRAYYQMMRERED